MKYRNAKNMLPDWLLKALQDYVQGEALYIPRRDPERAGWGEANGTKATYMERNREIMLLYQKGTCIYDISQKYSLSEYSIKKIISGMRSKHLV